MVTIGQFYGDRVEIMSGLTIGDRVITEGFQGLFDGQLITLQ
jgi:multidrug efflux pump subunit AcrA (membrane-fusion protein)